MKRSTKITIALFGAAAVALPLACAKHHHHRAHNAEHAKSFVSNRVEHVLDEVDASDEQRAKIEAVKLQLFSEFEGVHAGSVETKKKLLSEWEASAPDKDTLHALVEQRAQAYTQAAHALVDGMLVAHATLTAEQRAEIAQLAKRRMH